VNGGSGIGGEAALQAALLMDASGRNVILLEAFVSDAPEVKELLDRVDSRELDPRAQQPRSSKAGWATDWRMAAAHSPPPELRYVERFSRKLARSTCRGWAAGRQSSSKRRRSPGAGIRIPDARSNVTCCTARFPAAPRGLPALCRYRVTIITGDSRLAKVGEEPSTASKTYRF
jgi:hypothetical protein